MSEESALHDIAARTIGHYERNARTFWEGTRDHDVSQNIAALLAALHGPPPHRVLDLGCGPGRDLAAFAALGHEPVGLDASPTFCAMAREHAAFFAEVDAGLRSEGRGLASSPAARACGSP